jgi:hypothetical protein
MAQPLGIARLAGNQRGGAQQRKDDGAWAVSTHTPTS